MYNFRYLIALHVEFVICRKTLSEELADVGGWVKTMAGTEMKR